MFFAFSSGGKLLPYWYNWQVKKRKKRLSFKSKLFISYNCYNYIATITITTTAIDRLIQWIKKFSVHWY